MKRIVLTLALLLLAPCSLLAQSISIDLGTGAQTITPTAGQVTAIGRLRDIENARRAAENPPQSAITSEQWLRAILISAVQSYMQQAAAQNAADACVNYKAASASVRNQIDAALGGKVVCP